jgi:uncharacterized protein YoxC
MELDWLIIVTIVVVSLILLGISFYILVVYVHRNSLFLFQLKTKVGELPSTAKF